VPERAPCGVCCYCLLCVSWAERALTSGGNVGIDEGVGVFQVVRLWS
jgi:hypothetical protein